MTEQTQEQHIENMVRLINDWIEGTDGKWFTSEQVDRQFDLRDREQKKNRWRVLDRLCKAGKLAKHPNESGKYRYVMEIREELDWFSSDPDNVLPIKFPFKLESYCRIYPKSVIIVAGVFNSGKTAFMLNCAEQNMYDIPTNIFNSEMGAEEFKVRLSNSPTPLEEWRNHVKVYERSNCFEDVIIPDELNIIDYLEVEDNFYLVGGTLNKIFRALSTGVAIVALQKKQGGALGRGSEFSVEKARLAINIDPGELTIVKAKTWARPDRNPNGLHFGFKLAGGYKFIQQGEPFYGRTDVG